MDCMKEWSDRVNDEQVNRILEIGEYLAVLPADQKPMRMTLAATRLHGEGVARSQEEAYVMLAEALVNSEVMKLIEGYDKTLRDFEVYITKLKQAYKDIMVENAQLKALLKIQVTPKRRKTTGKVDYA